VQHRADRRCDDAHDSRVEGQRPLPCRIEQTLRVELCAEPLEGEAPEPAVTGRLDAAHDELEVAALLVEGDGPEGADLHALVRLRGQPLRVGAEHDGVDLGVAVAEAEVAVAGCVALPAGDLALDPERRHPRLQHLPHERVQGADGERGRFGGRADSCRRADRRVAEVERLLHRLRRRAARRAAAACCWRAASSVLRSSMVMVMGPTPPGTGVMASRPRRPRRTRRRRPVGSPSPSRLVIHAVDAHVDDDGARLHHVPRDDRWRGRRRR
jgi:hypothetical protein